MTSDSYPGKTSVREGVLSPRTPVFPHFPSPKTGGGDQGVGVELTLLSENTTKNSD